MTDVDFGRRSEDYAKYRPGFPESFYERVGTFISLNGTRAVDLGTGPGMVAIELAKRGATVTERLILQYNPDWTMADFDGLYPQRINTLIGGGFQFVEQFCYDHHQPFTHEAWRGRIRTCNGVGSGSMSESRVQQFDAALAELLRNEFPHEPLMIRHRIWVVIVRKPKSK